VDDFVERYGPWALIAGASEGIGAAFARALALRGVHLVLVARRSEVLEATQRQIAGLAPVQVRCIALDLSLAEGLWFELAARDDPDHGYADASPDAVIPICSSRVRLISRIAGSCCWTLWSDSITSLGCSPGHWVLASGT